MPRFMIERKIPNVGDSSREELKGIAQTSNGVLMEMGPSIQWVQSYVTGDMIYCTYIAPNADMVREHAERGGFPADKVVEIKAIIDPMTGEG
jgi:hypothetical protein